MSLQSNALTFHLRCTKLSIQLYRKNLVSWPFITALIQYTIEQPIFVLNGFLFMNVEIKELLTSYKKGPLYGFLLVLYSYKKGEKQFFPPRWCQLLHDPFPSGFAPWWWWIQILIVWCDKVKVIYTFFRSVCPKYDSIYLLNLMQVWWTCVWLTSSQSSTPGVLRNLSRRPSSVGLCDRKLPRS